MTMMAQAPAAIGQAEWIGPTELRHRLVRLATGAGAAAHASCHVRDAVSDWQLPVDKAVAAILASDLIINAVLNGRGQTLTLSIRCTAAELRVEVHDPSVTGDPGETAEPDVDVNRALLLAAALAADYGHYRTPAGRAVFYALAFPPAAAAGEEPPSRRVARGDGEP